MLGGGAGWHSEPAWGRSELPSTRARRRGGGGMGCGLEEQTGEGRGSALLQKSRPIRVPVALARASHAAVPRAARRPAAPDRHIRRHGASAVCPAAAAGAVAGCWGRSDW